MTFVYEKFIVDDFRFKKFIDDDLSLLKVRRWSVIYKKNVLLMAFQNENIIVDEFSIRTQYRH